MTPSQKNPSQKGAGRRAQGVGPEFKPQHCKKKKRHFCLFMMVIQGIIYSLFNV
jgi:hypothetical protein